MSNLPANLLSYSLSADWSSRMRRFKRAAAVAGAGALMFAQATGLASAAGHVGTRAAVSPVVAPAAQASVTRQPQSSIDSRFAGALKAGSIAVVYVSDLFAGTVTAYASNTKTAPTTPLETIAGLTLPAGLAVDAKGNLYVGEQNGGGIKVFAPGATTPFRSLVGSGLTQGLAVDAQGTIFAASATGVLVYLKGAITPSYTLSDPLITGVIYVAVDHTGNVIVEYAKAGTNNSGVGAFPAFTSLGASLGLVPRFVPLTVDAASGSSFAVVLDKNGDLLVGNNFPRVLNVGVYPPANQTAALSVNTGINTPAPNANDASFALTGPDNRHLFVAPLSLSVLYEFAYPSGKPELQIPLKKSVNGTSFVTSVATFPASPVGTW
jgi:hypothetical protein